MNLSAIGKFANLTASQFTFRRMVITIKLQKSKTSVVYGEDFDKLSDQLEDELDKIELRFKSLEENIKTMLSEIHKEVCKEKPKDLNKAMET